VLQALAVRRAAQHVAMASSSSSSKVLVALVVMRS
jgi:hypothetical protein